ncbi:lipid-A-disaccharide synthase [Methylococcus capsulatus]|uniref:lipid-A-disaccharide synthase n=1 Tax=Methylococcus capsulatus TaxID=414 RepID=UPI001C527581|nr:lipid-A-disaccharide synthase [Methylococcus capsulatus]QXP88771.1 lipid-A-disaccharide synthase [Methylococcus capsulatus]QXP94197.1 lipid-A-disaccharide synthase [Methylococcus capsulatus]UQN11061.1 lipid-A-disaccharide synthase [Methylococcus capsulatus]
MAERAPLVMLVAGESSGDQHAAAMFRELRTLIPQVRGIGMGGSAMREAGIDIRVDSTGLGVIGLAEIARHYGEIRRALEAMKALARTERPDLLICVDYKEFNFRLARAAKAAGIKVLFYVSPQVWAWRPGRVKSYGKAIDHMAVIFPFEVPFYERHGIPVTYVGHPLAGKIAPVADKGKVRREQGMDGPGPLVGLLPGSRGNEIRRLLPMLLQTAARIAGERPDARFVLIQAPSVADELLAAELETAPVPVRVVKERRHEVLGSCDAVITTSGTATLEVALLGVPMVIVYKLAPLSYWLGRLLVTIPFIGLPNILAGRRIVEEFIQHAANAEMVGGEILRILNDPAYALRIRDDLVEVRTLLGEGGGSRRLAELAAELLERPAR